MSETVPNHKQLTGLGSMLPVDPLPIRAPVGARRSMLPDGLYLLEPPLFVAGDDYNGVLVAPTGCWLGRISADYQTGAPRWMFALDEEGLEQEAPAGWEGLAATEIGMGHYD